MRFFRGIAVPADRTKITIAAISQQGLITGQGTWWTEHYYPGDLKALHARSDLSLDDTRPKTGAVAAACACGEECGASYYACSHNRTSKNNTPILIEFEATRSAAAVDGKDFLYTAFQLGDPERARPVLERAFGNAVLRYAEKAWSSKDQAFRVAQCDLAIHDPDVVEAHYANDITLAGRYGTVFQNAFTVALPVHPKSIIRVWSPSSPALPTPKVSLTDILRASR